MASSPEAEIGWLQPPCPEMLLSGKVPRHPGQRSPRRLAFRPGQDGASGHTPYSPSATRDRGPRTSGRRARASILARFLRRRPEQAGARRASRTHGRPCDEPTTNTALSRGVSAHHSTRPRGAVGCALRNRRSRRAYSHEPLELEELSEVLVRPGDHRHRRSAHGPFGRRPLPSRSPCARGTRCRPRRAARVPPGGLAEPRHGARRHLRRPRSEAGVAAPARRGAPEDGDGRDLQPQLRAATMTTGGGRACADSDQHR